MLKRVMATIAVISMLILILASTTVFSEESAEPIPSLTVKLNSDGTSTMKFVQPISEEEVDQTIEQASQSLSEQGFTVEKGENPTSIVINKTYPIETGYTLDLSIILGPGSYDFVPFKDFFSTKYGIKNTSFNFEERPAGQTLLELIIETPVKPTFSNATTNTNGGKTNTWTIVSGSKNEILLTFKTYNVIPLISTIFGIAILLVLLFVIISTSKKNKSQIDSSAVVLDAEEGFGIEENTEEFEDPFEEMEFDVEAEQANETDTALEEIKEEKDKDK